MLLYIFEGLPKQLFHFSFPQVVQMKFLVEVYKEIYFENVICPLRLTLVANGLCMLFLLQEKLVFLAGEMHYDTILLMGI